MTDAQWTYFSNFKLRFKKQCEIWNKLFSASLLPLQENAAKQDNVPNYPVENSIVYNTDFDNFTIESDIKLIVIGDNPGKEEQLEKNRKYLCGQSGKIAEGFFKRNPELKIDFRQNVIILNKTPVHTAKTKELKYLCTKDEKLKKLIEQSQIFMAEETLKLQKQFECPVWLVGYSEIKEKGIFQVYKQTLEHLYKTDEFKTYYDKLYVFQHFSMNRFLIDMKETGAKNPEFLSTNEILTYLGHFHKNQIFSCI